MERKQHEYYVRREAQAREHAERADDASARRAHLVMAARYSALTAVAIEEDRGVTAA